MIRAGFLDSKAANPAKNTGEAHALAERLPALILDAKRLAASLNHGLHGRRRSGTGENFWQFRPFTAGEPVTRIDWRRSARDHRLYVREREWEAARNIWLWIDRSSSMHYRSDLALAAKFDRALVLGLALAKMLNEGGERVGLTGLTAPLATHQIIERLAETLATAPADPAELPPPVAIGPRDEVILISDFFMPLPDIERAVTALSQQGARGHLVVVNDPAEESFPFAGETVLFEQEQALSLRIGEAGAWRADYLARLSAFREALGQCARAHGWSLTLHHTDRPANEAALKLITLLGAPMDHGRGGS